MHDLRLLAARLRMRNFRARRAMARAEREEFSPTSPLDTFIALHCTPWSVELPTDSSVAEDLAVDWYRVGMYLKRAMRQLA